MDITDIIISPLVTEKTHLLKMLSAPKLSFIVNKHANKIQIKMAFKSIFGFDALSVNTLVRKPQPTRITSFSKKNYNKLVKIAYITISKKDFESLQTAVSE